VTKIKTDLGMEFRSTDETIQASVRTLIKFGKLPAMESQLSPVAVAAIARELHEWAPSGVVGGGELISWLIARSSYQLCPTRAVRDAELLQKIGVIASSKQIGSILPSSPVKMLAVNVVEEAGKLGQFSIIFSAATPRNTGGEASKATEAPLPAEYQAVVDQTLAEVLQAASAGIAEGWENVKTEMDVTIQRRKGKTTVFKGTTGIKYASKAIQEHATLLETLPSIDPLFQEGIILKQLDDTADIRLIKYEGRSCLIVSDNLLCVFFIFLRFVVAEAEDALCGARQALGATGRRHASDGDSLGNVSRRSGSSGIYARNAGEHRMGRARGGRQGHLRDHLHCRGQL
jgi:hypothetical protein